MAKVELTMPKMGESIIEATILKWVKNVGDTIEEDDTILEIATDKVDSEVPSPVDGTIEKILFKEDDVVAVGEVIAVISTNAAENTNAQPSEAKPQEVAVEVSSINNEVPMSSAATTSVSRVDSKGRFYSPLVRS
ncbi:MAG: biotin/lipoyl-containing protein, partial [Bacteroidota bacterium]